MAICSRIIGRYLPHPCNRQIEGPNPPPLDAGRCIHCGQQISATTETPELDSELDFSAEELGQFAVYLDCASGEDCNPPEWGDNSFSGFT